MNEPESTTGGHIKDGVSPVIGDEVPSPARDEKGRLLPGHTANPDGRPKEDEKTRLIRKAQKELIAEYKQTLAEALPSISPVLIAKATEGDINAIKELNDRVMGKPKNVLVGGDEDDPAIAVKPLLVKIINGKDNGNTGGVSETL